MKIYCSGIGGIGLSAYAALQNANGHKVVGSDREDSALLDDLRSQGIAIYLNQDGSHVPPDADLFVYSEAIPSDAPEREKAMELGIKQVSYFKALGMLSHDYNVIAVCGTHGKSSTVAMATQVLVDAGLDPTVVVGTKLSKLEGRNWRKGDSNLFLLEACEYRKSFHHLSPDVVLMTNADGDHFDAFDSVEEYQQAFVDFLKLLPEDGTVITHGSDPVCIRIALDAGKKPYDSDDHELPKLPLVPGKHMQQNAQLVLGLAAHLNVDDDKAREALKKYSGCWRRMEIKGETADGVLVIDDYAHHPREIAATIEATREAYPSRRLICAYQPHMHNRTLSFYEEFLESFKGAGRVIVLDVYDARSDVEKDRVDIRRFIEDIQKGSGVDAVYGGSLENTQKMLTEDILDKGDVLLCLGAGDITTMASALVSQ